MTTAEVDKKARELMSPVLGEAATEEQGANIFVRADR
jgi:hypothetical protein